MYKMKYFTEKELKIDVAPGTIKKNMYDLVEKLLDPLRSKVGRIKINSAYRDVQYNKIVGGAINSQHTKGQAVDFVTLDYDLASCYLDIKNQFEFDQMIFENSDNGSKWIHLSYNEGKNRKECLIAEKVNGKWVYNPFGSKL